jgi:cytochrome P450
LHPPAWALFTRQVLHDVQIGEWTLPARSLIFIYPWIVHRDGRFYPEPEQFQPERFGPERLSDLPPGAYIPFGLGPHSCIGGRIASTVLMHVLPAILQHCQLHVESQGTPKLQATLSLRPRGDILMQVVPRDARQVSSARASASI